MHLGSFRLFVFVASASCLFWVPDMKAREVDRSALARADAAINAAIERGEIPGGVVLAGTDREIVHLKAFGNLAVEPEKIPMKTDTVFDLASLSKSIGCAISIMV